MRFLYFVLLFESSNFRKEQGRSVFVMVGNNMPSKSQIQETRSLWSLEPNGHIQNFFFLQVETRWHQ